MTKGISAAVIAVIAVVVIGAAAVSLQYLQSANIGQKPLAKEPEPTPPPVYTQPIEGKEEPQPKPATAEQPFQQKSTNVFFEQDGVQFEHYWPNSGSLGSDESEVLVYNDRNGAVQIISTDMIFIAGDRQYTQYSGTWEKFPSRTSWDRIEYINIHPNYYKDEPLILQPNQKGKIHYHYQFNEDISQKQQAVKIKIAYKYGEKSENIDTELKRTEYATPNESMEHS